MYSEQYNDLSTEEIEQLAEEEVNMALKNEKDNSFKSMLRGALLIVISIPFFAFHWKKAQSMWSIHLEEKNND